MVDTMLELGEFKIDLSLVTDACKKHSPSRIAVQYPAAFQRHTAELSAEIADRCLSEVFMLSRPAYGACDLPGYDSLKALGIDLLVHLGHSELPNLKSDLEKEKDIPTIFLELPVGIEDFKMSEKDLDRLGKSVVLSATVQYAHLLPKIAEFMKGFSISTHYGSGDGRIKYPGQVLGCNYSSILEFSEKDIDSYLYVGTGRFHPLGIALAVNKPVYAYDPHLGIFVSYEHHRERFLRKRHGLIAKSAEAEKFGIVVCTKPGQSRLDLAMKLKDMIGRKNKHPVIFMSDEITPSDFDYSDIDVIVSTACPRIALDDSDNYQKPMITPIELEIALDFRSWEDYSPDMISG